MSKADWLNTPMEDFFSKYEKQEDGTYIDRLYPLGEGEAYRLLVVLRFQIETAYENLLIEEDDFGRWDYQGEVPVIRGGQRTYEAFDGLTLGDLPAILDTFMVLQEEKARWEQAEAQRKHDERKARRRELDRERRKLKKLGEW